MQYARRLTQNKASGHDLWGIQTLDSWCALRTVSRIQCSILTGPRTLVRTSEDVANAVRDLDDTGESRSEDVYNGSYNTIEYSEDEELLNRKESSRDNNESESGPDNDDTPPRDPKTRRSNIVANSKEG